MKRASKRLGVGVVGLGHWGPNLLRNYEALGCLAAFCDTRADAREAAAGRYPQAAAYDDINRLLADPRVDAVAIATPAATHGTLVHWSLTAGKHVFVEKPLCLNVVEAKALKAQAERAGRTLMVGHLLLYHPAFRSLQRLVARGALGELRYVYCNRLSLGKIRREENSLWSFAPHDISMILALMGQEPEEVTTQGSAYLTPGVADTTLTHLRFPGGRSAHIFVSWLHPYKDHRMVVVGSEAMAVFDDVAQGEQKLLLYRHNVGWEGNLPLVSKAKAEPIPYDAYEPLRAECEAFLRAVRGDALPPSDAAEGIRVLRVLDACQRAIASGRGAVRPRIRGAA